MRLLLLTEYFPNPFKPYFDEQTLVLAEAGVDVRICAIGKWADRASVDGPVDLVARTSYAPREAASWRGLAAALRHAAGHPAHAARLVGREVARDGRPRALIRALTRALHLPLERPDCILVHDLTTLFAFRGVRSAYPGVPLVLWYHGGEVPGSAVLPEPMVREVLRCVTLGIGNTAYAADALAARGFPRERIRVMPIGVSPAGFQPPSPKRYRPEGVLRLLFVGRLSPEKGVDDLLRALAALRDAGERRVRLRIAGTGPAGERFRVLARELALEDRVEFLGYRDRKALAGELADADALVLPSRTIGNFSENQGVVMQEAMLMRLPVVTTRSGGIQESISPQNRALSVPENAPDALAASLRQLIEWPESRLAELGEDGRRFVLECYDPATLGRALLGVLREAMTAAGAQATMR